MGKCKYCRGAQVSIPRQEVEQGVVFEWEESCCRRCNNSEILPYHREIRLQWLSKKEPLRYKAAQDRRSYPKPSKKGMI